MRDFLVRLVERTLGFSPSVEPLIAPVYAPGPVFTAESKESGGHLESGGFCETTDTERVRKTYENIAPKEESLIFSAFPRQIDNVNEYPDGALPESLSENKKTLDKPMEGRVSSSSFVSQMHRNVSSKGEGINVTPSPLAGKGNVADLEQPDEVIEEKIHPKPLNVITAQKSSNIFTRALQLIDLQESGSEKQLVGESHNISDLRKTKRHLPGQPSAPYASEAIRPQVVHNQESTVPYNVGNEQKTVGEETKPVINVTIGRIEVRANTTTPPVKTYVKPVPKLSLEDYLKSHSGGGR